ncbi:MAG TPA: hypothetical protein ENN09_01905 [Planctomycetes bacterium]|nr:hypothetical protein [Planctomycetota bacterium]
MPDYVHEQKAFWLAAVVLAGAMLAGVIYPRWREVSLLRSEVREMEAEKHALAGEVERLREAVRGLSTGEDAVWERAVRMRLRYHPRGTLVYNGKLNEERR